MNPLERVDEGYRVGDENCELKYVNVGNLRAENIILCKDES